MSFGWSLQYAPDAPFPPFESKDIAADLLALHHAGEFVLSCWQYSFLLRVRPPLARMSERDRLAIRKIWDKAADEDWTFPTRAESPMVIAEKAVRRALGLDGIKRKKREKGEPKPPKLTRQEAEIDCPGCRTGARIRAWNNGAGTVIFYCQNRRCVSKMPHYQGWHPKRAEK